jgi:hypothetical protein
MAMDPGSARNIWLDLSISILNPRRNTTSAIRRDWFCGLGAGRDTYLILALLKYRKLTALLFDLPTLDTTDFFLLELVGKQASEAADSLNTCGGSFLVEVEEFCSEVFDRG